MGYKQAQLKCKLLILKLKKAKYYYQRNKIRDSLYLEMPPYNSYSYIFMHNRIFTDETLLIHRTEHRAF